MTAPFPIFLLAIFLPSIVLTAHGGAKVNPHVARENVCLLCHTIDPKAKPERSGELAYLTQPPQVLCETCHGKSPHVGAAEHLRPMPEALWKRLSAWQSTHHRILPLGSGRQVLCISCHNPHTPAVLQGVDAKKYAGLEKLDRRGIQAERGKSALAAANAERLKEAGITPVPEMKNGGTISLPFRASLEAGELCRICHEPE